MVWKILAIYTFRTHGVNFTIYHLWPVRLYLIFYTLPQKQHDFRKNGFEHKMCVLVFCTILSEIFLITKRAQRNIVINLRTYSRKVAVILVRI
jgi:hypothetical protein